MRGAVRRITVVCASLAVAVGSAISAPPAAVAAELGTATVGTATAIAVSPWRTPRGCSQFRVNYANLPDDAVASIRVLDAFTRSDMGGTFIIDTAPRSGTDSIQVCRADAEGVSSMVLQLDVSGEGVGESAPFEWTPTVYAATVTPRGWRCGPDVPASPVAQCIATYKATPAAAVIRASAAARRAGVTLKYAPAAVRKAGRTVTVVAVIAKSPR
jgi:hypothetical protein